MMAGKFTMAVEQGVSEIELEPFLGTIYLSSTDMYGDDTVVTLQPEEAFEFGNKMVALARALLAAAGDQERSSVDETSK